MLISVMSDLQERTGDSHTQTIIEAIQEAIQEAPVFINDDINTMGRLAEIIERAREMMLDRNRSKQNSSTAEQYQNEYQKKAQNLAKLIKRHVNTAAGRTDLIKAIKQKTTCAHLLKSLFDAVNSGSNESRKLPPLQQGQKYANIVDANFLQTNGDSYVRQVAARQVAAVNQAKKPNAMEIQIDPSKLMILTARQFESLFQLLDTAQSEVNFKAIQTMLGLDVNQSNVNNVFTQLLVQLALFQMQDDSFTKHNDFESCWQFVNDAMLCDTDGNPFENLVQIALEVKEDARILFETKVSQSSPAPKAKTGGANVRLLGKQMQAQVARVNPSAKKSPGENGGLGSDPDISNVVDLDEDAQNAKNRNEPDYHQRPRLGGKGR